MHITLRAPCVLLKELRAAWALRLKLNYYTLNAENIDNGNRKTD
jgi:hypothetical protein